jgi:hypothetical protein
VEEAVAGVGLEADVERELLKPVDCFGGGFDSD